MNTVTKRNSPLKKLANTVLDIVFPPRCISCHGRTEKTGSLCGECWGKIQFINDPSCVKCHHPFEFEVGENIECGRCIEQKPPYDQAFSVFIYNDASRKLVTQFKYSDKTIAAHNYADWMLKKLAAIRSEIDLICPVPLHYKRLLKRRYNQSALLALEVHKQSGIKLDQQLLKRVKNTPPQASLNRKERQTNVKKCFSVSTKKQKALKGKSVLLVDDVMTTGATIEECCTQLKKAGASKVFVVTLGRTLAMGI